MNLLKVRL